MTQSLLATIATDILRAILVDMRAKGDHVAVRLIDDELFYRQPIVTNDTGYGVWIATRGDYDLDCTTGQGRTEAEATMDLVEREEDIRAHLDLEAERFAYDHSFDDGGRAEERRRHP